MRKQKLYLITLLLSIQLTSYSLATGAGDNSDNSVTQPATDFTLKSTRQSNIRLNELRGHPVVLHFAAPWCRECPGQLQRVYQQFSNAGLAPPATLVVALTPKGGIADDHKLNHYPLSHTLLDTNGYVGSAYQVDALPSTLLIGPSGNILSRLDDQHDKLEQFQTALQHLKQLPALPGAALTDNQNSEAVAK